MNELNIINHLFENENRKNNSIMKISVKQI